MIPIILVRIIKYDIGNSDNIDNNIHKGERNLINNLLSIIIIHPNVNQNFIVKKTKQILYN